MPFPQFGVEFSAPANRKPHIAAVLDSKGDVEKKDKHQVYHAVQYSGGGVRGFGACPQRAAGARLVRLPAARLGASPKPPVND